MFNPAWIALGLILLSGCASTSAPAPKSSGELPAAWATPQGQAAATLGQAWWKIYGDAQLDRLVEEALAQNTNLALAVARVDEARAQLGITRANQAPSVDANFTRSRTQSSESSSMPLPPGTPRVDAATRAELLARRRQAVLRRYRR